MYTVAQKGSSLSECNKFWIFSNNSFRSQSVLHLCSWWLFFWNHLLSQNFVWSSNNFIFQISKLFKQTRVGKWLKPKLFILMRSKIYNWQLFHLNSFMILTRLSDYPSHRKQRSYITKHTCFINIVCFATKKQYPFIYIYKK
jgi:hypothetical protein